MVWHLAEKELPVNNDPVHVVLNDDARSHCMAVYDGQWSVGGVLLWMEAEPVVQQ